MLLLLGWRAGRIGAAGLLLSLLSTLIPDSSGVREDGMVLLALLPLSTEWNDILLRRRRGLKTHFAVVENVMVRLELLLRVEDEAARPGLEGLGRVTDLSGSSL